MNDLGDFEHWWEGTCSWVELDLDGMKKLQQAFFEVLSKLPESDFEKFLTERPHVICNGNLGVTLQYVVAVPPKIPRDRLLSINIILLAP